MQVHFPIEPVRSAIGPQSRVHEYRVLPRLFIRQLHLRPFNIRVVRATDAGAAGQCTPGVGFVEPILTVGPCHAQVN